MYFNKRSETLFFIIIPFQQNYISLQRKKQQYSRLQNTIKNIIMLSD